ncbi:MAG: SsrA-binding protein [Flavobacteriaceae bacterium]|nr:SsrA-binding protein [Flavobacteriaceae bacterium]
MKSKVIFKIIAKINKMILPCYSKKRLNLSKASKVQLGIIYWRFFITKNSL